MDTGSNLPDNRQERWQLACDFIARWWPPPGMDDGYSEADFAPAEQRIGVRIPEALREWYRLTGKRSDIWSSQEKLLSPHELLVGDGHLIFYVENQAACMWGIDLRDCLLEDPPVTMDLDEQRTIESESITGFALAMLAECVKRGDAASFWANGASTPSARSIIEASYPRLPFHDWHWPSYPTCWFGNDEIVIEFNGPADNEWIWLTARDEQAYLGCRQALEAADVDWQAWSE